MSVLRSTKKANILRRNQTWSRCLTSEYSYRVTVLERIKIRTSANDGHDGVTKTIILLKRDLTEEILSL